jgi:hypothetical protein
MTRQPGSPEAGKCLAFAGTWRIQHAAERQSAENKSILIQHIDAQEGAKHVNDATGHPTRSRDYRGVCC